MKKKTSGDFASWQQSTPTAKGVETKVCNCTGKACQDPNCSLSGAYIPCDKCGK